ncbi:hypothetical protein CH276_22650 [Rhodococcus sp. 06-470-2]|uniref:hypothetical protein n=1 Tax=unclassified Rhodococcus (in: high G+C Gram-positive bacteria) TaxID=192944 RepID=UPI000B9B8B66|nr:MULTISPECIES: hypothetical protein [unclassified Rhodococcus (in: high G+C Gram-positive bacteria)]OZC59250.1 hypothetical protein CH276_22650 [Rhodococcus sp. 06-470-2]OZE66837.1 hypothetical protein CH265_07975 [Rhodococcus sp. 05-2221-1B]
MPVYEGQGGEAPRARLVDELLAVRVDAGSVVEAAGMVAAAKDERTVSEATEELVDRYPAESAVLDCEAADAFCFAEG